MLGLERLLSKTGNDTVTTCGITFRILSPTVSIKLHDKMFLNYNIYMLKMLKESCSQ